MLKYKNISTKTYKREFFFLNKDFNSFQSQKKKKEVQIERLRKSQKLRARVLESKVCTENKVFEDRVQPIEAKLSATELTSR